MHTHRLYFSFCFWNGKIILWASSWIFSQLKLLPLWNWLRFWCRICECAKSYTSLLWSSWLGLSNPVTWAVAIFCRCKVLLRSWCLFRSILLGNHRYQKLFHPLILLHSPRRHRHRRQRFNLYCLFHFLLWRAILWGIGPFHSYKILCNVEFSLASSPDRRKKERLASKLQK